jgi:hypothetical protein
MDNLDQPQGLSLVADCHQAGENPFDLLRKKAHDECVIRQIDHICAFFVGLVFGKCPGLVVRFDRLLARPRYWVFGLSRVFF